MAHVGQEVALGGVGAIRRGGHGVGPGGGLLRLGGHGIGPGRGHKRLGGHFGGPGCGLLERPIGLSEIRLGPLALGHVDHHGQDVLTPLGVDDLSRKQAVDNRPIFAPDLQLDVTEALVGPQPVGRCGPLRPVREQTGLDRGLAEDVFPGILERFQEGVVDIRESLVRQSGERHQCRVVAKQPFEPLLRFLFGGQVLGEAEDAFRAVPSSEPGARFHGNEGPALGGQRQGTAFPLAPKHGGEDLLGFPPLVLWMHVQHMHGSEFFHAVAQRSRDGGVGEEQPSVRRAHDDQVGHGLEEGAEIGFAFPQRTLRLLLGGDVPIGADHLQGLTGGVASHEGESTDAMDASVRPDHAELGVELLLPAKRHLDLGIPLHQVVRVDAGPPTLIRATELIRRDSVEPIHLVVPDQPVVDRVVVPDAHAAGTRRQR